MVFISAGVLPKDLHNCDVFRQHHCSHVLELCYLSYNTLTIVIVVKYENWNLSISQHFFISW